MLKIYILMAVLSYALGFSNITSIGVLFDLDELTKRAFMVSRKIIMEDDVDPVQLDLYAFDVDTDIFDISQKACSLFQTGVAVIFGPSYDASASHLQSMCDVMEVPQVSVRWDPNQERMKAVNVYPHAPTLAKFFQNLIDDLQWKSYTVLYDNADSLLRLHLIIQKQNTRFPLVIRSLGEGPNYRDVLREVKDSQEKNIIIQCEDDILEDVLIQSLQVGILSNKHRIIIGSLNLQNLDLYPFQHSGANFTGIRLVNTESPYAQEIFEIYGNELGIESANELSTEQALYFDALQLFVHAFKQLRNAVDGEIKQMYCNGSQNWEHGSSLTNYMLSTQMMGLSGPLMFDPSGYRSNFNLDILKLDYEGLKTVGVWNSSGSIEWLPYRPPGLKVEQLSLHNMTFRVLISLTEPYGMIKKSVTKMSGNDRYEGFAIDIIEEMSKLLGFNYTYLVQEDSVYGSPDPITGEWSGMLGRIIDNEADLAITDLTITAKRAKAVDFTTPFMNLGISILFKKPTAAPPSLITFLLPFSTKVWVYLMGTWTIVSVLFFLVGRMCPEEWNNPFPCIDEPEELSNQFTLKNSFWFTMGALFQQGSEIAPIGKSTRMMAGIWWFFCIIMVNSYTANLAACLVVETVERPLKVVDDLPNQKEIKYGAKKDGATFQFFATSNSSVYQKMAEYMKANEAEVMPTENDVGKLKVLKENYAFLMESSSIEYIQERECNLTQIGGLLDQKGYGIAMRKNVTYQKLLNGAVLKLQEMGMLTALKNKWWKEKGGGGKCAPAASGSATASKLGLPNVGGAFLTMAVGVLLSFFVSAFELLWNVFHVARRENISVKAELMEELKCIVHFSESTKPVRRRKASNSNLSGKESTKDGAPPYGYVPTVITTTAEKL